MLLRNGEHHTTARAARRSAILPAFGGLILLDRRENSCCVPVNRASSVLAGLAASVALAQLAQLELPGGAELVGAGLVVLAIVALSAPALVKKRA